jgi:hypothetical protein
LIKAISPAVTAEVFSAELMQSARSPQDSRGELVVNGILSSQLIAPVSTGFAGSTDLFSE